MTPNIRPPAVAGMFYPGDALTLRADVQAMLRLVPPEELGPAPKALIVPHAGYIYSGPTAAFAYARLIPLRGRIRRVVLLGPTHRIGVRGLALPGCDAFATPLGTVPVDHGAEDLIKSLPQVIFHPATHAQEHSLEVQLPFLQEMLGEFSLVPLAVGDASPEEVAQVLEALWGGPETLIVISSDLSHFHAYATAREMDGATALNITRLTSYLNHEQACGATPVNGLLLLAKRHGLLPELLDLRNSGDTAGDRSRVVGYGAFAFTEGDAHVH
ncbi:MAG: AmmeMemoRadiSam system protein B [Rhodocyclaceae bacterium]|nr:AmmeMemoRadiSam system protein B [Rhodocyclaceae bacterium]